MGGTVAIAKKIFKPAVTQAAQKTSPTAPMVSQATATSMDGYDSRKTKAKRSSFAAWWPNFCQRASSRCL